MEHTDQETPPRTAEDPVEEPTPPDVDELEEQWAALSCDCEGDFL